MILGIVGSEGAKFTSTSEVVARQAIRHLLTAATEPVSEVVSGACHLGGIDVWAVEEAQRLGIPTREFPPREHNWSRGYRLRNIQIAQAADEVVCFTLRDWPATWTGMRWERCYHCPAGADDHVKSGGCWTVKFAREQLGKHGAVIVLGAQ